MERDDSSGTSKTFLTGKKKSRGLTIPAYLAHKYEYSEGGCYVVLTEEDDGLFVKKLDLP